MKKIEVFLRQCYYSKLQELSDRSRPSWFNKIKVFNNFKNTLDSSLVNYTIVYDEYYGDVKNTHLSNEENLEIIKCGSECESFIKTLDLIESRKFDDDQIVYLLEDDYVHRKGWCDILLEGMSLNPDYLTLYSSDLSHEKNIFYKILTTKSSYWRSLPVTSNTFACRYKTLKEDMDIHRKYSSTHAIKEEEGYYFSKDYDKFWELTRSKKGIVSPIPGWSTHCDSSYLTPIVDWESIINDDQIESNQTTKPSLIYL